MRPIWNVVRVRPVGPYRLKLWFSDGQAGEWDFAYVSEDRGEFMAPFKEPAYFDRVGIECGALTWPNGYDLSPVALHDDMSAAGALSVEAAKAA